MASSLVLKRLAATNLLTKSLLHPLRPLSTTALPAVRSFNTNARHYVLDDHDDERSLDIDRCSGPSLCRRRDDFLSDVFDTSSSTRSLSQALNRMDQFSHNPFLEGRSQALNRMDQFSHNPFLSASGLRPGWDAREDGDAMHFRIDMPGLSKEDVKVSVEQNTLIIKGEGEKESDDEECGRRYTSSIDLPEKVYKIDQIKAEMKNGALKVVVPKVKEEERTDVVHVKVE